MNGRTREGFYVLWTIAILLCLAVCVVLLAYVSIAGGKKQTAQTVPPATVQTAAPDGQQTVSADGQTSADAALTQDGTAPADGQIAPETTAEPAAAAPSTVLTPTMDLGAEYQNKLVFLGDSTTYGLATYGALPIYQVWVPASGTLSLFNWAIETVQYYPRGNTTDAQSLSIADAASAGQPEYLIITLGINGVDILSEEQFRDYYTGMLQAIQAASPNTRIMCQSIFPVIDSGYPGANTAGITNAMVSAANGWIQDMAARMGLRYLNTAETLVDENGNLNESYCAGDGIHMNTDGYNAILQYVRTHAYQ